MQPNKDFLKLDTSRDAAVNTSYVMSHKITKYSKSSSDGSLARSVWLTLQRSYAPKQKDTFANVPLSRRTVTRRVEDVAFGFPWLWTRAAMSVTQFLIFVRGMTSETDAGLSD